MTIFLYVAPCLDKISFASFSVASSLASTFTPMSSAPCSFNFLLKLSSAGISFTHAAHPLNQKLTSVTSFLLNKDSSTSLPSKSFPLNLGNICASAVSVVEVVVVALSSFLLLHAANVTAITAATPTRVNLLNKFIFFFLFLFYAFCKFLFATF